MGRLDQLPKQRIRCGKCGAHAFGAHGEVSPCSVRLGCWETAADLAGTLALGNDEELAIQLYTALSAKSWRVFYAPVCLPPKTKFNTKEWELKYLHACANSGR